jgi:hypothetical protein
MSTTSPYIRSIRVSRVLAALGGVAFLFFTSNGIDTPAARAGASARGANGGLEACGRRRRPHLPQCEESEATAPAKTNGGTGSLVEPKPDEPKRAGVAKSASAKASIFRRAGGFGKPWHVVDEKEGLPAGDMLLGLPLAAIDSSNGAIHVTFLSDLDELSPYPVKENAIVLWDNAKVDFEFTLDRGRVDLINTKQKGEANVRVHIRDAIWDLALETPGTRVALETYGRWPRGARFTKTPGPKDAPTTELAILVLKGEAALKHKDMHFALKAPPGPALIQWDSVTGMDDTPMKLDKLPPWAASGSEDTPRAKVKKAALDAFRQDAASKPIGEVLDELVSSDDAYQRKLAIMASAAFDDLERLGKALREAKHPDVWDNGVLALRQWIGRGPGQDMILYKGLLEKAKLNPVQAETVMQLLHSFSDEDLANPALYQTLIDYLSHDQLAIRGLANWHLYRLVPEGRDFGYNPLAPKEDRDKAIAKWKLLIPVGKMPPAPKSVEKKEEPK